MSFLDLANKRYSARIYTDKPVTDEQLETLLAAAQTAPTAANLQPVRLITVCDKNGLEKIGKAANIYGAPLAVIVCADREKAWRRPFDGMRTTDIDASIVTDHMMLCAADIGLDTVWICYFKPDIIRAEFDIPENIIPVNILAVGYSDEKAPEKKRLPISSLVINR